MVPRRPVASLVMMVMSSLLCCSFFSRLFALASFHLCFLQQPSFLRQSLPLLAVFDLVLSDQRFRWAAKYTLILAEFTYPYVFGGRWTMQVRILLLDLSLTRGQRVYASWRPLLFSASATCFSTLGLLLLRLLLL